MKKLTIAFFVCLLLIISSCTKEGPAGPAGPSGASIPVIVEDFTIQPTDWQQSGTAGAPGAHLYYYYATLSLDTPTVQHGTALLYRAVPITASSAGWEAVPYTFYNTGGTLVELTYIYTFGLLDVHVTLGNNQFANITTPDTYKIVIIPGTPKTSWPVDLSDYAAVKKFFHLK